MKVSLHQFDRELNHPSFDVISQPQDPRQLRHTLTSKHLPAVEPFLPGGVMPPERRSDAIKDLHTSAVAVAVSSLDARPNRVLKARPSEVHRSASALPRHLKTSLSQLRSGFCRSLNSYRAVVDHSSSSSCPDCLSADPTPSHLFECPVFPTTLYVVDLWANPLHAAHFLSRLPCFSHLPPIPAPSSPLNP